MVRSGRSWDVVAVVLALLVAGATVASASEDHDPNGGYILESETFKWPPIENPTTIDFGANPDSGRRGVALGFFYDHYGVLHKTVTVSVNGGVTFDGAALPDSNVSIADGYLTNVVAPLWDDWSVDEEGLGVTYGLAGPDDDFVIEWHVKEQGSPPNQGRVKFRLEIPTSGGETIFHYRDVQTASGSSMGGTATVGVASTTSGLEVGFEQASFGDLTAWLLYRPICARYRATIVGTDASETILGTTGPDVIVARGGHDVVNGMGGDDVLCGSGGNDVIRGGVGNDLVYGLGGNDVLYGGEGDDSVFGGGGDDIVHGSEGADDVNGESGDDIVYGGGGNDAVSGSQGADMLVGGGGNDEIVGGPGNDDLRGGNGSDVLFGNAGSDELRGGVGDDLLQGGTGADELFGGDGFDELFGGPGMDYLAGGPGDDVLSAGPGIDELEGNIGDDTLSGGDDDDTLIGGAGIDVHNGGLGVDSCVIDAFDPPPIACE